MHLSALFLTWGLDQLSLLLGSDSAPSRMSLGSSAGEGEALGSPAAFGSSPGCQPACPPCVMGRARPSCPCSPCQDSAQHGGLRNMGLRSGGTEPVTRCQGVKIWLGVPNPRYPHLRLRGAQCRLSLTSMARAAGTRGCSAGWRSGPAPPWDTAGAVWSSAGRRTDGHEGQTPAWLLSHTRLKEA